MTDLVTFGEATLRLRTKRGSRLSRTDTFDTRAGGLEGNTAVTASALNADAVWLSRLPESPLGRRVISELRSHGVRTGVSWGDEDDRLATVFVDTGVEPRGRALVRDDAGTAFTKVHAANLPLDVVRGADCFYVTGITPSRSKRAASATASLLETAAEAGTTTAFDLRYRERCWTRDEARAVCESLFANVDVLFATLSEAGAVFDEEGDPVEVAHALRTTYEFETVVLLRRDGSAFATHGDEIHEAGAVEGETVDAAGSEDAFVGGFLAQRVDGGAVDDALRWGAAASALAKTLDGDAVDVPRAQVERIAAEQAAEETGR
ncbi:MAG: sugar kinase [Halolamina sp.]